MPALLASLVLLGALGGQTEAPRAEAPAAAPEDAPTEEADEPQPEEGEADELRPDEAHAEGDQADRTQRGEEPSPAPPSPSDEFEPDLDAPEGLNPLLLTPLQAGLGSFVAVPLTLVFPVSPIIVSWLVATAGDLIGQQRGVVFWPAVIAYAGMLLGASLPALGWVVAFLIGGSLGSIGLLLGGTSMGPYLILAAIGVGILYITGVSTFVVPIVSTIGSALGQGCGAALGYFFLAENKHLGDVEFRFPGLFDPSHGPDRYYVERPLREPGSPSPVVMAY